jgi:regulator of chromosome condensation
MAPRNSTVKRKKSDVPEKSVKKPASVTTTTTTTGTTTRRASQPLAPSTSQNSVVKPSATTKHKPRKSSQTNIKLEPSITVQAPKSRKPVVPATSVAKVPGPKLNVYVFGSGSMGELGLGPQSNQRNVKRPRLNPYLLPDEVGIVDIAVGGMHCAAIDERGRVWTWGVNDQGVLGRDTTWSPENEDTAMDSDNEDDEQLNPRESMPGLVEGFPEGTVIVKIACGDSITVAATDEGRVYAWGTFRVRSLIIRMLMIVFGGITWIFINNTTCSTSNAPSNSQKRHSNRLWSRPRPRININRKNLLLGKWSTTPTRSSCCRTNSSQ